MNADMNEILAEYTDSRDAGEATGLSELIAKYPEHADELAQFALFADVTAIREPVVADDPAAEVRFVESAARVAVRLRAQGLSQVVPLVSIVKAAARQGLSTTGLAELLGLSVSFVARLDQRLFRPATIPMRLVASLSEVLNRTAEDIRTYLALPPTLAREAIYRSSGVPAVQEQIDFAQTVEDALDMSEDQKRFWRSEG